MEAGGIKVGKIVQSNKLGIKVILVSILCVLSVQPYVIWFLTDYLRFLGIICMFLIFRSYKGKPPVATIWAVVLIFYAVAVCFNAITQLYDRLAFELLFLLFLPLINNADLKKIYALVVTIVAIIYLLGMPLFLIDKIVKLPFITIPGRNPLVVQSYRCYIFFVQAVQDIDLFPRFRSIFDEAGVVGTLSFLVLTGNRYKLNNWKFVSIFAAGLLSLSFFFYLGSLIMFFLFNLRNKSILFGGIAFVVVMFFVFQNNEVFGTLILNRFVLTDNGVAGDNRTTEMWNVHYKEFSKTQELYTGKGLGTYDLNKYPYVASYQTFIYEYGWIFAILTMIYFFLMTRKGIPLQDSIIVVIAFMLAFYQRPWVFDYFYTTMAALIAANIGAMPDGKSTSKRKVIKSNHKVQMIPGMNSSV